MANKSLFSSLLSKLPRTDTKNDAGGRAYAFTPKHALAQLAATGCFNGTFYADAEAQLSHVQRLAAEVNDPLFLAKLAVYSRERAMMKDMPAALVVMLASRDSAQFHTAFDRVINNGRMLRTAFQMIRSGQFGRKSLTGAVQRAFQRFLNSASVDALLSASIGNDPSLRDILRLARPTPADNQRRALFGWLTDKDVARWTPASAHDLPEQVQLLQTFRKSQAVEQQIKLLKSLKVRWDLLADTILSPEVWAALVPTMGPQALRMNLNTLARHGVFNLPERVGATELIASRLSDPEEVKRSKQFPYQFFSAYLSVGTDVPARIKSALSQAAELACGNVPELPGPIIIGLDVSGSMRSAVTGHRGSGTSAMRCVDVAALFAAAILRRNPDSVVIPFDDRTHDVRVDPQDSILSLAERLATYGGGGTNCALPLEHANARYANRQFAGCVLVSDNESWIGTGRHGSTPVITAWSEFVHNQLRMQGAHALGPKLVCIDLQPNVTTQAPDRPDVLNVGGFSDAVFEVVNAFLSGDPGRFVEEVEAIEL